MIKTTICEEKEEKLLKINLNTSRSDSNEQNRLKRVFVRVNKEKAKNTFKTINMFIAFLLCKIIEKFIKLIIYKDIVI